jgi:hypothetical protein
MLNKRLALFTTISAFTAISAFTTIPNLQHKADTLYIVNIDINPVTKTIITNP